MRRRAAGAAMAIGIALACAPGGVFVCQDDQQCGADGACQATGGCSFPDDECDSGQRYGDHAPDGLAGQCVNDGETSTSGPPTSTSNASAVGTSAGEDTVATTIAVDPTTGTAATTSPPGDGSTTDPGGSSSTTGEALDPDLLLWFQFEGTLDGVAIDSGVLGLDGTCPVGGCPSSIAGPLGNAADFAADAVGLTVPSDAALSLAGGFTIAAWLRAGPLTGSGPFTICSKALASGSNNSFNWIFGTGQDADPDWEVALVLNTVSPSDFVAANYDFPLDEWVHVASVWDGAEVMMYVNGQLASNGALPVPTFDDNPITIGFDLNAGTPALHYPGAIDDLRIYARALDAAEVASLPGL